jgi:hypothetical protein
MVSLQGQWLQKNGFKNIFFWRIIWEPRVPSLTDCASVTMGPRNVHFHQGVKLGDSFGTNNLAIQPAFKKYCNREIQRVGKDISYLWKESAMVVPHCVFLFTF